MDKKKASAADSAGRNNYQMMTSSNGNIFRVTGPLCGEFTGPGKFHIQWPVTRNFDVFFDLRLRSGWVINNREAGDFRRHRGHYDAIVMYCSRFLKSTRGDWVDKSYIELMKFILIIHA